MGHNAKKDSVNVRGDVIEVKLRDVTYEPYFKQIAHINNKKEMLSLMQDLKDKGVRFPISWFE